ncbi:protein associated with UVRAG as autophagy enhancer [Enoplosus armatus]|uniref:protein associated with UVRAG as autophagy enhancer n=1 Tax=Enoplosus armatus TaxID=215367 RepID=UPI0039943F4D
MTDYLSDREALLHQEVCTKAAVIGKLCPSSSVQLGGSCRDASSSPQRSRYVSGCDATEPPTPGTAALAATATPEEASQQNHQPGSVPLLLLSPPEASGGETNPTCSRQRPQSAFAKRTHHEAFTRSRHSQLSPPHRSSAAHKVNEAPPRSPADEGDGEDGEDGRKGNEEDPVLLHLAEESFFLPRSSPVISRRHRPVSWHGGGTDTSPSSSSASPPPVSGSLNLDRCGGPKVTSMEDLRPKPGSCHRSFPLQEDKKPSCVSVTSNLNRLLSAGLHLPFSGQQRLAEEHGGRGSTSCDAPHSSGLSTSTQHSKERRFSDIPELSADIFKTSCELEKENAHFVVVDMVLEVLEGAKWTLSSDGWTPGEREQGQAHPCRRSDESSRAPRGNTPSSYEDGEEAGTGKAGHQPKTFSVLSTDSGFEDCGVDATLTPRGSLRDAECLAQQLVLQFRRSWLPSHGPRRGRQSLRSSLQELPGTGAVAVSSDSLAEEIRLRTRMRGSLSWAPPRLQIIFTVQPTHRRSEVVALQHFLCAGCGTEVEPKYIKKLRYCEYLGRYFCDCCHSGAEAVVPGRLLSCWDFGRYPVSDFSKQLLDSVWHQPLFDLTCVGKTLYGKVKELDKFRELQEQLLAVKKLLTVCRLSGRVMAEFEQLPAHLTEQPHLFSMDDLLRAKKGQLAAPARAVLRSAIDHVENCELCLARGFICEFCRERDIIFPFQRDTCRRCPVCRACFHKHCFVEKKCPKCARIQAWKKCPDGSTK